LAIFASALELAEDDWAVHDYVRFDCWKMTAVEKAAKQCRNICFWWAGMTR